MSFKYKMTKRNKNNLMHSINKNIEKSVRFDYKLKLNNLLFINNFLLIKKKTSYDEKNLRLNLIR